MNIEYKNKDDKEVAFGDIKTGEIFLSDKNFVYIKAYVYEYVYENNKNACRLSDGSLYYFNDRTLVKPLKGKLIIEEN